MQCFCVCFAERKILKCNFSLLQSFTKDILPLIKYNHSVYLCIQFSTRTISFRISENAKHAFIRGRACKLNLHLKNIVSEKGIEFGQKGDNVENSTQCPNSMSHSNEFRVKSFELLKKYANVIKHASYLSPFGITEVCLRTPDTIYISMILLTRLKHQELYGYFESFN